MIINKYVDTKDLIITEVSKGRLHYGSRLLKKATSTYDYTLKYGENYHTLSMLIFGSDEYWWVLADLNKLMDNFELEVGTIIKLPLSLVNEQNGVTRLF